MRGITCVLDACTVINLLHIDEDEVLLKKLESVDYFICDEVMREIQVNVFKKFDRQAADPVEQASRRAKKKEIEQALVRIRTRVHGNERVVKEMGADFFDRVRDATGYAKDNGEFRSAALSLCLSRCRPSELHPGGAVEVKLFFHTDDSPARQEFGAFFRYQQIGSIEDSVDLLVLLHRLEGESFNHKALDKALLDLQAEYMHEVNELIARLRSMNENLSRQERMDRAFKTQLSGTLSLLEKGQFQAVNEKRATIAKMGSKFSKVVELIDEYPTVLELENREDGIFKKIKEVRTYLPKLHKVV